MSNGQREKPRNLITHGWLEQRVAGLRDTEPPPQVRVYGLSGQLLRIDPPKVFEQIVAEENERHKGQKSL